MGRLKALRPTLGRLSHRVGFLPVDHDKTRAEAQPWRAWYGTARWQKLRWDTLVRDGFTCQMCGRFEGARTHLLVGDHKRAHRGDPVLFWDPDNIWTLCKTPCHDSVKQAEEVADRQRASRG